MLEAKGVGFTIGDNSEARAILHDINVHIKPGSLVGIIGPNGAGKTTLMRIMAGVARPTAGAVFVEGQSVHDMSERRRARVMAYMSQSPSIGFGFTVQDVVAMGRYAHRGSGVWGRLGFSATLSDEDREAIGQALALTDVTQFRDRPVTNLSGGERQRVFLARTLAQQPRLLFLDEPTSDLDIRFQLEMLTLVQRLQTEQQITVVMAIHDLTWALRFCDTVLALRDGQVAAFGGADRVLTEALIAEVFDVTARIGDTPGAGPRVDFIGAGNGANSEVNHTPSLPDGQHRGADVMSERMAR